MANENIGNAIPGLVAGGTIHQYHWVKISAAKTVIECTAVTDDAIGIAQDDYVTGDAVTVAGVGDVSKMLCGGNIDVGAMVGPDANAHGVAIAAAETTKYPKGRALEAGANNRIISVYLQPGGRTA